MMPRTECSDVCAVLLTGSKLYLTYKAHKQLATGMSAPPKCNHS